MASLWPSSKVYSGQCRSRAQRSLKLKPPRFQVVVASSSVSSAAPTITTSHEGPVSSDAALAQLAAEAGLLEGGEGSMIQVGADSQT